jgi:hypothetical protein
VFSVGSVQRLHHEEQRDTHVDRHPPLISVEATGVCIPIGNNELLFAAVNKSPGRPWGDADIIELLGFQRKTILAGDLKAKHQFWNSSVSSPFWNCSTKMNSKFQHHNVPLIIPLLKMETY